MYEEQPERRPVNPRRKRRSRIQIIKEDYLPVIIVSIGIVLIFTFIIGSIVRGVQRKRYERDVAHRNLLASQQAQTALENEAADLMAKADILATQFDYVGALEILDQFSGDMYAFPDFSAKYTEYVEANNKLVLWEDPNAVLNLSFHPLVADPERAFAGTSFYKEHYITVDEFNKILQQLYENGYMLVRYSDVVGKDEKMEIRLPEGKRPLIITETQVNYNVDLVDSDSDGLPDKNGRGFAHRLMLNESGELTCEIVDKDGKFISGAYDIVPILNAFVKNHPDFSYRGAKAVLALSGHDGLFGYRTSSSSPEATREAQIAEVRKIIDAIKRDGYELACYTYSNKSYKELSTDGIKTEMQMWNSEVTPLLGNVDLFVFAKGDDIADISTQYAGEKYEVLKSCGFTGFIGFCSDGKAWFNAYSDHTRMGRIMVTGSNLQSHPEWFEGMFDTYSVKDPARN